MQIECNAHRQKRQIKNRTNKSKQLNIALPSRLPSKLLMPHILSFKAPKGKIEQHLPRASLPHISPLSLPLFFRSLSCLSPNSHLSKSECKYGVITRIYDDTGVTARSTFEVSQYAPPPNPGPAHSLLERDTKHTPLRVET